MTKKVTIIGAGLVGSLLAVLLRNRGHEVSVYEKRSDPRKDSADGARSINLVVTSRGLNALKCAGLLSEALGISVPVYGRMIHAKSGEQTFQPYGRDHECNYSISRGEFNKLLIKEAVKLGVRFYFDQTIDSIDFTAKSFKSSNGQVTYDLLFGADGAGSQVRKALAKFNPAIYEENTQWLEADYKELLMPAVKQKEYPLQKIALHIWPRGSHMLMALANQNGSFTMTLYLPKQGAFGFDKIKSRDDIKNLFNSEFSDAVPLMPNYISEFENHPQGALGTVRCAKWILNDSVALIGDAAHAIVPFFGQGMNCGFEDCTVLIDLMGKHSGDWQKILSEYENSRMPNANAIADMALENWVEMSSKVGLPEFQLRKKVEAWLEEQFPDAYKTRYRLITYTLVPYALAQEIGVIQDQILKKLCAGITDVSQLSKDEAQKLIDSEISPFIQKHDFKSEMF
ncbi:MAG: NAD(P)/FAD-dependent oxidoreductase [Oligoflexia bacterium]|nr:NAD(P)/FAD-dependent oxidoreductase [Oligoflexia bacterium]